MSDVNTIRKRLLGFWPDTYDKSEGTVLWDLCQAYALDFEEEYSRVDNFKENFFLKTATDIDMFDNKIADYGETRKAATFAEGQVVIKGTPGITIEAGTLVASDLAEYKTLNTVIIPSDGKVTIPIKCTTAGTIGNVSIGVINKFPVTISGLNECYNNVDIENAVNEESLEEARARVEEKLQQPRTSGNIYDYKYWAKKVDGVGNARIIPRWNGINTVKILIADRNNDVATESLIKETYDYIENLRPVGSIITVESAKLKIVNIKITGLTIDTNANQTAAQIKLNIKNSLKEYINSISLDNDLISYAQCSRTALDTEGVGDFISLTLNDSVGTLQLN
ncbi:MAG: baseplate J/gp47 family protein, partial [Fusobacteriaceae bacterium]|nr:baseplate J/gp47 family protein [Fusobacteriaceae bacterium]